MDSLLIVSSSEKGRAFFTELFPPGEFLRTLFAASGKEARRMLLCGEFDLILINAPLEDEYGHELAAQAARSTASAVILAARSDARAVQRAEEDGVFLLQKPVNRAMVYQALRMAAVSRKRFLALWEENRKLTRKLEETRLVDRAKCALIQHGGLSEQEAHRLIEKRAMDQRTAKREIALEILREYEP